MSFINLVTKALVVVSLVLAIIPVIPAQQQEPKPEQKPEVIRTETNLVQTGFTVFDKQGAFVDGLRLEDFELRVDGKPTPISFLSRVTAGTAQEQVQLAAARNAANQPTGTALDEERGRTITFFIDDLHLSSKSVQLTKKVVQQFLTSQMGPLDQVKIASASGQIGFLQQFTDNKTVLRAAIERLNHRPYQVVDSENIPMTEYIALRVDQGDHDALAYFTNELLKANNFVSPGGPLGPPTTHPSGRSPQGQNSGGLSRQMAERMVKERAKVLVKQSTNITTNTLIGLQGHMRAAAQQPGRKLVFFVSDGFYLHDRNSGFVDKLREITDTAVRSGLVIYALDSRGLGATIDTASNRIDSEGKLSRANIGELQASQDGLNALAEDTGGRALFDSDRLSEAVEQGLKETSNYYLFAWRPSTEEQMSANFKRIEISVVGRPELSVRRPRGYLVNETVAKAATPKNTESIPDNATPATETKASASEKSVVDVDLRNALSATVPAAAVPTSISSSFVDTPDNGMIVTAAIQAGTAALDYGANGEQAAVDIAGIILSDQGKTKASFKTHLNVNSIPGETNQPHSGVVYNYKTKLAPGIYQIRAAVRDEKSGKLGSATQWIEVPDLSSGQLTLSTLLLRGESPTTEKKNEATTEERPFSVDHRFRRGSRLSYFLFVYNASRSQESTSLPDVTAQVQVFRRGKLLVASPVSKIALEGADIARIPYGGMYSTASLTPGRYEIQVTITDRRGNSTAAQRTSFQVD